MMCAISCYTGQRYNGTLTALDCTNLEDIILAVLTPLHSIVSKLQQDMAAGYSTDVTLTVHIGRVWQRESRALDKGCTAHLSLQWAADVHHFYLCLGKDRVTHFIDRHSSCSSCSCYNWLLTRDLHAPIHDIVTAAAYNCGYLLWLHLHMTLFRLLWPCLISRDAPVHDMVVAAITVVTYKGCPRTWHSCSSL